MTTTTTKVARFCNCGAKLKRKYQTKCDSCVAREVAERDAVIAKGVCPDCEQALRRNTSMTGWWQCSGFGAEGFRAKDSKPCSFQIFGSR